jgi:uncharacterized membrane protein YcjF (UPF0283 family)
VKITPPLIIVGVAMLFFYLRLAMLRGRKRRLSRQEDLELRRSPKKRKAMEAHKTDFEHPRYEIRSWAMVIVALVLMLAGVTMYTANWFPQDYQQYWWIAATGGVLLFTFCFK